MTDDDNADRVDEWDELHGGTEDAVDPEDPRPSGHYQVDRNADWYYVDDDLARTVALGPPRTPIRTRNG